MRIRKVLMEVAILLVFFLSSASATKYNCNDYLLSLGILGPKVQMEELKSIQKTDTVDIGDIRFTFREICYNHDIMIAAFDLSSKNAEYLLLGEGASADILWYSMTHLWNSKTKVQPNNKESTDVTVADIIETNGYKQIWVVDAYDVRDKEDIPISEYSWTYVIDEETNDITIFLMIEDGLIQSGEIYNVILLARPWLEFDDPFSYDHVHQAEANFKIMID